MYFERDILNVDDVLEEFSMVNLQKEFEEFHDTIKLKEFDENETLRKKRDILLKKLRLNISEDAASYTTFNQGSYAMGTGIKPENGDYDIDVGICFDIDKIDYPDPIVPKKWVYDALEGHTKKVEIRRSCVTVTYQDGDEPIFHVDFAVYANANTDNKMYIAKGKEKSSTENRFWEESNPEDLIKIIKNKFFDADDKKQFRRIIRYLKKWKAHNPYMYGNGVPTGIAITILTYELFEEKKTHDFYTDKYIYNDFEALMDLVHKIRLKFEPQYCYEDGKKYYVISQELPVAPYNDLFSKMTNREMQIFYEQISVLEKRLGDVSKMNKKSEACEMLIKIFGEDFPNRSDRSIVSTSESA